MKKTEKLELFNKESCEKALESIESKLDKIKCETYHSGLLMTYYEDLRKELKKCITTFLIIKSLENKMTEIV